MEHIDITGINRTKSFKALKHNISSVSKFFKARKRAAQIIRDFDPDIVIGTGGYVSAPVLSAACAMRRKTLIHEQNAFAGFTTKLLAKHVDRIVLSFPLAKSLDVSADKLILAGNPVSREFGSISREDARRKLGIRNDKTVVLSYGGSLGAKRLNEIFCEAVEESLKDGLIIHYHGAGGGYDYIMEKLGPAVNDEHVHIEKYIYNMPVMMAAADLVVSRSGAGTVTELEAAGRASILIPSPNVTENHQYYNACTLRDVNAAVICEEKDTDGKKLYESIKNIVFDSSKKNLMERAAKAASKADTLDVICNEIEAILHS